MSQKREFNVGDTRINHQGLKMTIIKIHDGRYKLIDVQFEDGYMMNYQVEITD